MVIVVIWKDPFKELKGNSASYLILNLAICDLLTGFPGMLLRGLLNFFPANNNLFASVLISLGISISASHLTIVSLAIERLIVVSSPLRSADYLTIRCLTVWIISIWTVVILPAYFLPPAGSEWYFNFHVLISDDVIGMGIIILLLACYMRIYILVRKTLYLDIITVEERRTEGQVLTENGTRKAELKTKDRKVLGTVVLLTGVYLVCWIPFYVLQNIDNTCSCFKFPFVESLLLSLHALLDPLCYSLCTAKFRRALLKIWSEWFNHINNVVRRFGANQEYSLI